MDPDQVFAMALRFRELVAEYLASGGNPDRRFGTTSDDARRR